MSAAATSRTCVTPPGAPSDPVGRDGLHRIDDQQVWLDLLDLAEHRAEPGFRGQVEVRRHRTDPVGARPDLRRPTPRRSHREPGPDPAASAPTSSSSVDLPTPGSPASRSTAPGTRPPPSTRSSSSRPVGLARRGAASTSPIGTAGVLTGPGPAVRSPLAPAGRPRLPRPCPTPRTRRICPPTWLSASRIRAAKRGHVDDFAMPRSVRPGTDIPGVPSALDARAAPWADVIRQAGHLRHDISWPGHTGVARGGVVERRGKGFPTRRLAVHRVGLPGADA